MTIPTTLDPTQRCQAGSMENGKPVRCERQGSVQWADPNNPKIVAWLCKRCRVDIENLLSQQKQSSVWLPA